MLNYRPVSFRLAVAPPRVLRQEPNHSISLGSSSRYRIGESFDKLLGWGPAAGDAIRLAAHGMAAYLGYYVWLTAPKKSFPKYFGLAMALIQTYGAVCDVISMGKRVAGTHPPEAGH